MSKNNASGCGTILFAVFFFGMIIAVLFPKKTNETTNPTTTPSYLTSEEKAGHDYARTRFRQEGYSDKEAKQAADVILRFQRSQNK